MYEEIFEKTTFPQKCVEVCQNFAQNINFDYFYKRNQYNEAAIRKQQLCGKLAEFLVYLKLREYFPNITKPDIKIYTNDKKNWEPDLKIGNFKLHVKSMERQTVVKYKYPLSWMFQYKNKSIDTEKGKDLEVFTSESHKDILCFVGININESSGRILAMVPLATIVKNNLFSDPKKESLKGIKKVVLYQDLKEKGLVSKIPVGLFNE